tara:strand:+ start:1242 stop:1691 length:450 start_codon:yes stop_codon:yes gene_type:complete
MLNIKDKKIIAFVIGIILPTVFIPKLNAGSFGAEIFCTMREGGNDHESSWEAAYTYIKKQKGGFFKTSPYQAASQIIETVVREKDKFNYCVEYLDQLYPDRKLQKKQKLEEERRKNDKIKKEKRRKQIEEMIDEDNNDFSNESFDRYSY